MLSDLDITILWDNFCNLFTIQRESQARFYRNSTEYDIKLSKFAQTVRGSRLWYKFYT